MCSADQTATCHTTGSNPVCNPRRKRSAYRHARDLDRMFDMTNALLEAEPVRNIRSVEDKDDNVTTFSEAYDKCLEFFSARPLYQLKDSVPDARLNLSLISCANDATIDITKTSWMSSHFESWALNMENEVSRNITFRETQPENLARFQDARCLDDCSGHGLCVEGECVCDEGYASSTCFIELASPLTLKDIEGDGICDANNDNECHGCLQVKTEFLLDEFYCNITVQEISTNGHSQETGQFTNSGEYENLFEGRCCTQSESRRRRALGSQEQAFVTNYRVAVSNDGIHFGPPRNVYVYDSACQDYTQLDNGDLLFSLKPETCFIEGKCFKKGQTSAIACDKVCWPENSVHTWSTGGCNIVDGTRPGSSNNGGTATGESTESGYNLALIIPVTITGLVVLGLAALLIIWKVKRPGKLGPTQQAYIQEPPAYINMPTNKKFGAAPPGYANNMGYHNSAMQFPQKTG